MSQLDDTSYALTANEIRLALSENVINKIDDIYKNYEFNRKENFIFVYESFKQVVRNESILHEKLSKLTKEYDEVNFKLNEALKLADCDQKVKEQLLTEFNKARSDAISANKSNEMRVETIRSLKLEVSNLSKLVEQGFGMSMGQEYNIRETNRINENVLIENRRLTYEVEELNKNLSDSRQNEQEMALCVKENKQKVIQSHQTLLVCQLEKRMLTRQNTKLKESIDLLRKDIEVKDENLGELIKKNDQIANDLNKKDLTIEDLQLSNEKLRQKLEIEKQRSEFLESEVHKLKAQREEIFNEKSKIKKELTVKINKIEKLEIERSQFQKSQDDLERKLKVLEEQKSSISVKMQMLEMQIEGLDKQINVLKLEKEKDKKTIQSLINEKDKNINELKGLNLSLANNMDMMESFKTQANNYKRENLSLKKENAMLSKNKYNFDKEESKFMLSKNEFSFKINNLNKLLSVKISELEHNNERFKNLEDKLLERQRMYEDSCIDRNLKHREIVELKYAIKNLTTKLNSIDLHNKNLDDMLRQKNSEIIEYRNRYVMMETNLNDIIIQNDKNKQEANDMKNKIAHLDEEKINLKHEINNLVNKLKSMETVNSKLLLERNVIGSQLVRRNDEIFLLYRKIELLEGVLKRGQKMFDSNIKRFNFVQTQLASTQKQNEILKRNTHVIQSLKREIFLNEKELTLERAKLKASEKLQSSLNIHRWRHLSGSDPTIFELIQKLQILQKRLIIKTEQVVKLELKFIEKDKVFMELKKNFSRRLISDDDQLILSNYKNALSKSIKKIKSSLAEEKMASFLKAKDQVNRLCIEEF